MRVEKAVKNSVISIAAQIGVAILQLVNRKLFVMFLDMEYLGFQSVFGNIFTMLSAVELGISEVIIYQLFRELAQNNQQGIRSLMTIYKRFYWIVALLVTCIGAALYFALPYIVTDATTDWNTVYTIYFINLLGTALTYVLSYRRIILLADQKQYVCEGIDLFTKVITVMIQLLTLVLWKNFILYVLAGTLSTALGNLLISRRVSKLYPYLNQPCRVTREEIKQRNILFDVKNYAVHKLAGIVYYGTDSIVITSFCGIRAAALYSSYYLISSQVQQNLISKNTHPKPAAVGSLINSDDDRTRHRSIFDMLDFSMLFASTLIGTCFLVLLQPFIQLWLGEAFLLPISFVILFVFTICVGYSCETLFFFRSAMGSFNVDRNEMVLSAVLNLAGSIAFVGAFGISGVQMGTLLGLIPILTGRSRLVVKGYFHQSLWRYWGGKLIKTVVATGITAIAYIATLWIPTTPLGLVGKAGLGLLVTALLLLAVFGRTGACRDMLQYCRRIMLVIVQKLRRSKP